MSSNNTRSLCFVSFVSSLVVLTIKRDAQAIVFAECLIKGFTNQGEQSEFFSTSRRTKWLLVAICTGNLTEIVIELIVFAVLFSFRRKLLTCRMIFKSRLGSEHDKIKNSDTTEKQQQQRALQSREKGM